MLDTETRESSYEDKQPVVKKLTPDDSNTVLLCTSAGKAINPSTGG